MEQLGIELLLNKLNNSRSRPLPEPDIEKITPHPGSDFLTLLTRRGIMDMI